MFDFGNANENQRKAIRTVDGPVLITAGPGTGKTYTLVQRAIFLIQERGVRPEEIMISTFTEKAAKELITRITNELAARNISVNINEMYIGTFHSLCLRMIKDHLEDTRLKRNYRMLDTFDQNYTIFQHIHHFRNIPNYTLVCPNGGAWTQAQEISALVNNLSEELVTPEELKGDSDPALVALGEILELYYSILLDENLMDFSSIQTEAYRMLRENPKILQEMRENIKYIMIDEYQDTNFIQEQIVFLLGEKHNNICVVGDDDQGLYRFRGATIRNILEFPQRFEAGKCCVVSLVENYRSNSDIVDFYNTWMSTTSGHKFKFEWGNFRYPKIIVPYNQSEINSPAVVKLSSDGLDTCWHEKVLSFIDELKESGKLTDYNQIAFLFSSVKNSGAQRLAKYLEDHGINVYSPRSDMFFKRDEIMLTLGCFMIMFPKYVYGLEHESCKFLQPENYIYYENCIKKATEMITQPENEDLLKWIKSHGKSHITLSGTTDYAYTGLLYQMFAFAPFRKYLDVDMTSGVVDVRPARNLALLSKMIGKYEYIESIDVLSSKTVDKSTERLFNLYLRLLIDGGINEYEDDSEYAPSGCVSFLTIHQSKGMEFPIVFVDSLGNAPRKNYNDTLAVVADKYYKRTPFEPLNQTKFFDFWRLYYTAFSRAQDLLVLTCHENSKSPSKYFSEVYDNLIDASSNEFDVSEFDFKLIKDVNIKESYSFTSHITVYETCAMQYKFYKELGFMPVRASGMLFGMLVHQTIEDIHHAAIQKQEHLITHENIISWFESNYISLTKSEHSYLAAPQLAAALKQVQRYVDRQNGRWDRIKQAEVDVSLVKPEYIIEGKIDLIQGEGDTVEIVDFKSEKKPDIFADKERLERYRRQLHIYAYLVEERTGHKVSQMHLYYTGEEDGNPMITYPYTRTAIEGTMAAFDDTVQKIQNRDFSHCANKEKICKECDFRFYCRNN